MKNINNKWTPRNFAVWAMKAGWDIVCKAGNYFWKNKKGDRLTSQQLWDVYEDKINQTYLTDDEKQQ